MGLAQWEPSTNRRHPRPSPLHWRTHHGITHVGMNILTNILGKASRVDIDFPKVELRVAG